MARHSFRWGIDVLDDGYVPVYNFMLRNYARAGVTRSEFLCIIHLAAYHYDSPNGKAEPAQDTIAKEMGYKHRNSVNNLIKSLRDKALLLVEDRPGDTLVYNFAPFSRKMYELWQAEQGGAQPNVQVDANPVVQVDAQPNVHEEEEGKKKKEEPGADAPEPPDEPEEKPAKRSKDELDELFEVIAAGSFGITDLTLVKPAAPRIGKLRKWYVETFPEYGAAQLRAFYGWWRREHPNADTPNNPESIAPHFVKFVQLKRNGQESHAPKEYKPETIKVIDPARLDSVTNPARRKEAVA